jgi:glycerol-3-phosphate dehydrogenase
VVPVPGERNRFVFAVPQPDGLSYVGITDEPVHGPIVDTPDPTPTEIGFLLETLNSALGVTLTDSDVVGAFAGLRPLLAGRSERTADLSRRHLVRTSAGITTVVGGKLTTYRRMARDAVDAAIAHAGLPAAPCRTGWLPLVGAAPPAGLAGLDAPARLIARYGAEAPDVLALAADDPDLLHPIADGTAVTGAELRWGVREEGALDEADLLDRRTRIGLRPADRARALTAARNALAL